MSQKMMTKKWNRKMHKISKVLDSIHWKDWNPKLADMEYWRFEKVMPQSTSPTCLFTVRAQCTLDGYEKIVAEWNVDQADLRRKEIAHLSDPEEAYVNFIKAHFNDFMADVRIKFAKYTAKMAGIILPQQMGPKIVDGKHQRQMDAFKNMMYDYRQKKARGRV